MVICLNCNKENIDEAVYCSSCGSKLDSYKEKQIQEKESAPEQYTSKPPKPEKEFMKSTYVPPYKISLIVFIIAFFATIAFTLFLNKSNGVKEIASTTERKTNNSIANEEVQNILASLAADVQIDYFIDKLGKAVFVNMLDSNENSSNYTSSKEYVFVNPSFYVSATTDINDKVLVYAITARDKNLNFKIKLWNGGRNLIIDLGKTKFGDLSPDIEPEKINTSLGARRYIYNEIYYFGNPGHYQTYIFGINDAGIIDIGDEPFPEYGQKFDNPVVQSFRKEAVINTYAITAPYISTEDLGLVQFGVDLDQVRVLK